MVSASGVLIPLERAVAIRQKWMFAVPVSAGLGWIALLFAPFIGGILLTLASLGTLMILGVMVRREPHLHTLTMFVGVLAWVAGNLLWFFGFTDRSRIAFLVLTIGGNDSNSAASCVPGPDSFASSAWSPRRFLPEHSSPSSIPTGVRA
jgi:hypothetical protein